MSEKILSVIVPSYNMEKYLPKCLGSLVVAPELMEGLEVIVVNDGSRDRTSEIAHEFATKWVETFKVIDKENGHYGSCVNAALKVATGKYVRILDADDYFDSTCFVGYLKWLDRVSKEWDPDCIVSDFRYVDGVGTETSLAHYGFPDGRVFTPNESLDFCGMNIGVHAVAHRLGILRLTGFHQTEGMPYSDTEWSFLPMFAVYKIAYFPQPVKCYLEGREGQTMSPSQLRANASKYVAIVKRIFEEYGHARAGDLPDRGKYCRHVVEDLVKWILSIYLLGAHGGAITTDVAKEFDEALRFHVPDVYRASEEFAASRMRFRYVKAWRENGYDDKALNFRIYRLYRTFVRFIRRWGVAQRWMGMA